MRNYFNIKSDTSTLDSNPSVLYRQIEERFKEDIKQSFYTTLNQLGLERDTINAEKATYRRVPIAIYKEIKDRVTVVLDNLAISHDVGDFAKAESALQLIFNKTMENYTRPLANANLLSTYREYARLMGVSFSTIDKIYMTLYPEERLSLDRIVVFLEFRGLRAYASSKYQLWLTDYEIEKLIKDEMIADYIDDLELLKTNIEKVFHNKDVLVEVQPPEARMQGVRAYADAHIFNHMRSFFNTIIMLQNRTSDHEQAELVNQLDDVNVIVKEVEARQGFNFTTSQNQAIQAFWQNKVMILSGEAGSGKTTTVRAVTEIMRRLKPDAQLFGASFTARASFNLAKLADFENGEWSTLHKLKAWNEVMHETTYETGDTERVALPNIKDIDVLVVEEFSMINLELINQVLPKMKDTAKVLFVGDIEQLPPIDVGFAYDYLGSQISEWIVLLEAKRQDKDSHLYKVINDIKHNDVDYNTLEFMGRNKKGYHDFKFITASGEEKMIDEAVREYFKHIRNAQDPKVFDNTDAQLGMRVLATTNRVVNGTNAIIQQRLRDFTSILDTTDHIVVGSGDFEHYFYRGDRVVINKNLEGTPIANGMAGTIIDYSVREANKYDLKLNETYQETGGIESYYIESIDIRFDDFLDYESPIVVNGVYHMETEVQSINYLTLGYASTVHKAQGLTLDGIIFPLVSSGMNSKQIAYTALSRASKWATLITSTSILRDAIDRDVYAEARTLYHDILRGV